MGETIYDAFTEEEMKEYQEIKNTIYNKDEFYKGYVSIWNADEIKFKEYNRLEELLSDIYFDFGYFENEIPKREIDESLETELKDNKIKQIEIFDILLN